MQYNTFDYADENIAVPKWQCLRDIVFRKHLYADTLGRNRKEPLYSVLAAHRLPQGFGTCGSDAEAMSSSTFAGTGVPYRARQRSKCFRAASSISSSSVSHTDPFDGPPAKTDKFITSWPSRTSGMNSLSSARTRSNSCRVELIMAIVLPRSDTNFRAPASRRLPPPARFAPAKTSPPALPALHRQKSSIPHRSTARPPNGASLPLTIHTC